MKNLLIAAAALSLVAAPMASGQERGHGGGHGGGGGHKGGGGGFHGGSGHSEGEFHGGGGSHHASTGGRHGGEASHHGPGGFRHGGSSDHGGGRSDGGLRGGHFAGGAAAGFHGGPGFERRGGGFVFVGSRGLGAGFHQFGRFSYRGRFFNRFRVNPFFYPAGWGYREWGVGAYLPALFVTSAYFVGNYGGYGLGPPPPGCRWVRYGPDVLAVNVYTGEVVDAVRGVFWW